MTSSTQKGYIPKECFGINWQTATNKDIEYFDVHSKVDERYRNPLHYAANWCKNVGVIKAIIAKGIDADDKDDDEYIPLHMAAARNENHEVAEALIQSAPESVGFEGGESNVTPLHMAAYNKSHEVAQVLIDHRAKVNAKSYGGDTPLHIAALKNNYKVAEILVDHDAEINVTNTNSGNTPLHNAAISNAQEIVQLLLKSNADTSIKNSFGKTAWEWGKSNKRFAESDAGKLLEKATGKTSCHA